MVWATIAFDVAHATTAQSLALGPAQAVDSGAPGIDFPALDLRIAG